MKKILAISFLLVAFLCSVTLVAQEDKSKRPSPPSTLSTTINGAAITINYSQPSVKGRTIGNEIAPYGKVWRTGANEATTFQVDKNVNIEGKALQAGTYSMFTIPGEKEWVLIFNKQANQWGSFKYDQEQDVIRVNVKPAKAPSFTEQMTFVKDGSNLALLWGNTKVPFRIK